MLKRFAFSLIFSVFLLGVSQAQLLQPAKLTVETPTKPVAVGDEIELVFKATIDKDWYLYSVGFDEDCGPIPMSVTLEKHPSFSLVGGLRGVGDHTKHDKQFDCDVKIFEGTGEFRQKIKVLSANLKISASYEGQSCSTAEGKCVPIMGDLQVGPVKVTGEKKKLR
ncbi:protein-disulfide reductase DsbD domain-containing protein [Chryseolinea soli]|uniref:Thiol:disulfide interchange protein DsbD N-terminal domain-containing protein n=1 Tax=Chryseolinea soli TaxID=2321403 RepID=A0A385SGY1_9BACT|nr:hypothetical protein D4L85_07740 [Chryseolinea soli]